jgi:starch synthase (maltosyl-transferring)
MDPSREADGCPRIYYVNPLLLAGHESWLAVFDHAKALGFNAVLTAPPFMHAPFGSIFYTTDFKYLDPALGLPGDAEEALARLARDADDRGLSFMLDISTHGRFYGRDEREPSLDPRQAPDEPSAIAAPQGQEERDRLVDEWQVRIARFAEIGLTGFRCLGFDFLSADVWQRLIQAAKDVRPDIRFFAYTPGTDFTCRQQLQGKGFAGTFSSLAWWDLSENWFRKEYRLQQKLGLQITFPEAPFSRRLAHGTESREVLERRSIRALRLAVLLGDGLMVPMGFEYGASLPLDPTFGDSAGLRALRANSTFDISGEVRSANAAKAQADNSFGGLRVHMDAVAPVTILVQADQSPSRRAEGLRLILVNRDLRRSASLRQTAIRELASPFLISKAESGLMRLAPGEIRILETQAAEPVVAGAPPLSVDEATASPRIAIEKISPQIDGGRFPVKRIVGDLVTVEADIFADGHDLLAAALLYRAQDEPDWRETRMNLFDNDRWRGSFALDRNGRYEFCVEAWKNPFAIYRYELTKKHEARLDLHLELIEGTALIEEAVANPADAMPGVAHAELDALLDELKRADEPRQVELLLSPRAAELMAMADRRPFRVRSQPNIVDAERRQAGFASWYQLFPRSQSGDPNRHGTFDDVIARLPAIRDMGFDVLYFPPVHPIGHTNRKGRNNSLSAAAGDPGSPYAIGSEAGGHDAIHPELGTFEDFHRLIEAARREGLEIALDLAIQASPDHPWLTEHPGWFDWRPDGTIRYAENPPKKYEDIVNVDFYEKDAIPGLWIALRDIVDMWVGHGVKLFRVDNPHTKPLPFWEWMIGDIRARHPEVIFLSEAFTRPKVMYRLAKVGFSQSYTYFTWRNTKWELEEYMRELTRDEPKEFFRPHFFVNTHDINPDFLQNAPRPAYLIRAALAATLSGLWGVYNGFELCEGRPDAKRKEYADSEKYEIRAWDYDRPGNIKAEIAMLNDIRRENVALQSHLGLTLLNASNGNLMFFEKASAGRHNVLLVAISLDPHNVQESAIEVPLWHFGLNDGGTLALEDLIGGHKFSWTGKWQNIGLDPNRLPFAIWRVRTAEM